jgi:phosphoglycolate phosphatase
MRQAYFFDLDGTLVNTIYDIADGVNRVICAQGCPPRSYDEYLSFMGEGIHATFGKAMPGYRDLSEAEKLALRREYETHSAAHCLDKSRPYDGIPETLAELRDRGALLGVYTNKSAELSHRVLGAFFPAGTFAFVLGAAEGIPMKPHPARLLAAMGEIGAAAADSVYVGDGAVDIVTGKNAGIRTCGVLWGFKGRGELEAAGADIIINSPADLLEENI